ncbi:hypothetical protein Bpfe_006189 [Biomphalaria pfeifferi]|uniref:Uncharacterized protein n=1 Tax=Biomphalaria pfeifferi TaxID=112525 RepID=A0AAD8C2Z9_BIOPF|nr:hypothetical protein Bpfe_006189 [Biomphalaria pfeifferi]
MAIVQSALLQQIKETEKSLSQSQVWPPTLERCVLEMSSAYNCLVLNIRLSSEISYSIQSQLDSLVSKSFYRVLVLIEKDNLSGTQFNTTLDAEAIVLKILNCIKEPMTHFKMLSLLPHLLVLWSISCLYRWQWGYKTQIRNALKLLVDLKDTVDQSILNVQLQFYDDLFLLKESKPENSLHCDPTVQDVVKLVLAGCRVPQDDKTLDYVNWEWLYTLVYCEDLIKQMKYLEAVSRLDKVLKSSLEPEQKSKLLCLVAQCYFLQGFPHLSIKVYQEALTVYKENSSVLFHLAKVYEKLNLESAQLEMLSLLIQILAQRGKDSTRCSLTRGLDVMIDQVCEVSPEVNLTSAYFAMAACCNKMKRYKEASQHYRTLLQLLDNLNSFSNKNFSPIGFDISTVLIETSKAMVLAEQYFECISFCDKYYPCWTVDNSLNKKFSIITSQPTELWDLMDNSQQSLFSDSQCSNSLPVSDNQCENEEYYSSIFGDCNETISSSKCNHNVCQTMRKRLRSASVVAVEQDETELEFWLSISVAVKLLLSKSDALFATESSSDETMNCLTKAYHLLVDSKLNIFTSHSSSTDLSIKQPSPKRRRLNLNWTCDDGHGWKSTATVTGQWSDLVVTTSLKIAQVSYRRKQYLSVQNACSVVLQLDPHNVNAHYLRTVVLKEDKQPNIELCRQWLQERNITCDTTENISKTIETKQRELHSQPGSERHWWLPSAAQLLNLDIDCLTEVKSHLLT